MYISPQHLLNGYKKNQRQQKYVCIYVFILILVFVYNWSLIKLYKYIPL